MRPRGLSHLKPSAGLNPRLFSASGTRHWEGLLRLRLLSASKKLSDPLHHRLIAILNSSANSRRPRRLGPNSVERSSVLIDPIFFPTRQTILLTFAHGASPPSGRVTFSQLYTPPRPTKHHSEGTTSLVESTLFSRRQTHTIFHSNFLHSSEPFQ